MIRAGKLSSRRSTCCRKRYASACWPPHRNRLATRQSQLRNSPANRPPMAAKCAWPPTSNAANPTPIPPRSPARSTASPPSSRPGSPANPPAGGTALPSATKQAAGVNSNCLPTVTRATTSPTIGTATTIRRLVWSSPRVRLARCGRQQHRSPTKWDAPQPSATRQTM